MTNYARTPSPSPEKELPLVLTFADVEAVLGLALPERAFVDATWWDNDAGHAHATGLLDAGWRTSAVDLDARRVTLDLRHDPGFVPKRDRYGCMAGTIWLAPDLDLTAPSGEVWNAELGLLLNE